MFWDTQTGIAIWEIDTQSCDRVVFHGDQKTITLVKGLGRFPTNGWTFYTYDVVSGTQLCQVKFQSPAYFTLGASWVHEDTFQFAVCFKPNGKSVIKIHELQITSTPPLHTVSSFPVPFYGGGFSFSPAFFHVSFVTKTELIILDIQSSQLLLQTKVGQVDYEVLPQFSANGHFVACKILENEIHIWQNAPTGYMPWCSLRARLPFEKFLWSPTSVSILCWGLRGIQLLHPDNCLNLLSPNEAELHHQDGDHLVAYSADKAHIAIAEQGCNVVTVFDFLLSTPQQVINTDMKIKDIKIIDNTIFVIDVHKLVSWELEAAGVAHCSYSTGRVINESLAIKPDIEYLSLSHDCSQVAYANGRTLSMYNVQVQETLQYTSSNLWVRDIRFSPSGHHLWFLGSAHYFSEVLYLKRLEMEDWLSFEGDHPEDKYSSLEGDYPEDECSSPEECSSLEEYSLLEGDYLEDQWSWINLFSSHGYCVKMGSKWITNSRGSKLLWLPPAWRTERWNEVRWDGDFLALLSACHPKPIIIGFQPQSIPLIH